MSFGPFNTHWFYYYCVNWAVSFGIWHSQIRLRGNKPVGVPTIHAWTHNIYFLSWRAGHLNYVGKSLFHRATYTFKGLFQFIISENPKQPSFVLQHVIKMNWKSLLDLIWRMKTTKPLIYQTVKMPFHLRKPETSNIETD